MSSATFEIKTVIASVARDFSPRFNFQCRLSYGVRIPSCAIACIIICAHVKDPVVHVRVWWIMELLQHSACTVGWVARLCCSWLSPGKATRIRHGRNPNGTIQLVKTTTTTKTPRWESVTELIYPLLCCHHRIGSVTHIHPRYGFCETPLSFLCFSI